MASKSRAKNTLINTTAGFGEKLVVIITGFIMRSVFIKLLGIQYAGVSSLFTDILSTLSLAELGISSAISYALYRPVATNDHRKIAQLMNFYKRAYQVVAIAVMAMGCAIIPLLRYIVKDVPQEIENSLIWIYILYVLNSAVSYLLIYKATLLTAHQEHKYVSFVNMIGAIIKMVVEVIILFALKPFMEPTPRFIVYLVAGIIITRTQNYVVSRVATKHYPEINDYGKEMLPKGERKKLFKDIGALMMYKVSNAVLKSIDSVIISAMFGTIYVGYLGNYYLVTQKVTNVVNQFYNSATPSIGNLATTSDDEKQYRTFKVLQFMAFWICCFCSVSFFILLDPFINVWLGKKEFLLGTPVVIFIVMNFYTGSITHPVTSFRNSNGLFVQGKFRPVIMAMLNIGLSFLFGYLWSDGGKEPIGGIIGVKFATTLSRMLTLEWYDPYLIYKEVFHKKVRTYFATFTIQILLTAACCAFIYLIGLGIDSINGMNIYLSFVIKCVLCLIIPNAMIVALYHKKPEYKEFICILKGFIKRKKKKSEDKSEISEAK